MLQKRQYDKRRVESSFKVGDEVLLENRSDATGLGRKLAMRSTGPWRIVELLPQNLARLEHCETGLAMEDRVNIDRLRPFRRFEGLPSERRLESANAEQAGDGESGADLDDNEFIVEKIVSHREFRGRRQYRVKWAGFSNKYNRWVDEDDIVQGAETLLRDYERRCGVENGREGVV